jgi:hypothetical protein
MESDTLDGLIHFKSKTVKPQIEINANLNDKQQGMTLLHEIIHAALVPLRMTVKKEEALVLRLERSLSDVIRLNPGLIKSLSRVLASSSDPASR